jgi:hypothetical protein
VNHTSVGELFCCVVQQYDGAMVSCCFDTAKQQKEKGEEKR